MEVPTRGNVQKVIEPVLKKHGYSLDIIELRFANTFKVSLARHAQTCLYLVYSENLHTRYRGSASMHVM